MKNKKITKKEYERVLKQNFHYTITIGALILLTLFSIYFAYETDMKYGLLKDKDNNIEKVCLVEIQETVPSTLAWEICIKTCDANFQKCCGGGSVVGCGDFMKSDCLNECSDKYYHTHSFN